MMLCSSYGNIQKWNVWLLLLIAGMLPLSSFAAPSLKKIDFASLPGDTVQLQFELSENAKKPVSFTTENPARIVLDFHKTKNGLKTKQLPVGIGVVNEVVSLEAGGRTRVVLKLDQLTNYETKVKGKSVFVTVSNTHNVDAFTEDKVMRERQKMAAKSKTKEKSKVSQSDKVERREREIENIDFRRGDEGEGRLVVNLSNTSIPGNVYSAGGKIIVEFRNVKIPGRLNRRLDVTDFATPVRSVDTRIKGKNVQLVITTKGKIDHMAYQFDKVFTLDVKQIKKEDIEAARARFQFNGERLSLNFKDIEVRAVLQLLADFTGINMVTSDDVGGNVTLRLKNVPWDQALDIILKSKGLAKREAGNVMLIAPSAEITAREKKELEAAKLKREIEPLVSDLVQVNYAKASELKELLMSKESSILTRDEKGKQRGNVTVDDRTNSLLIQETADQMVRIRKLIHKLDVPVRQVLIDSRIVLATDRFAKSLGTRWGVWGARSVNDLDQHSMLTSGTTRSNSISLEDFSSGAPTIELADPNERLNVNLPASGERFGSVAFSLLTRYFLVDLELSAMQAEGKGEVVSNPRVVTANRHKAVIEQGTEVPYQTVQASSGTTTVTTAFKQALLKLEVTPQITPDDRIVMDLEVTKDNVGQFIGGEPTIDTKKVKTQVLVNNGETVVLGGVYEEEKRNDVDKVPFFGSLPILGRFFRMTAKTNNQSEVLVFVTPKILKNGLSATAETFNKKR